MADPALPRREPYRLFFPLAGLLALVGVGPWVLFSRGLLRAWPGVAHSLVMTEGFVLAVAAGFLGTMMPRRTGGAPLSRVELAVIGVGLAALPCAALAGWRAPTQLLALAVLATLAQFAIRRMRTVRNRPALPPSFVLIPFALLAAVAGTLLLVADALLPAAPAWSFGLGRSLVTEGLFLPLVLALAPMLSIQIAHDGKLAPEPATTRRRLLHALAGLVLVASLAIERVGGDGWPMRFGLFLRGAVVAAELVWAARIDRLPSAPGLHRRLYWLALVLLPLGLLCAGAAPAYRIGFLHLSFVGGVSLLVFAVSTHVVFEHTGRVDLTRSRPWPVALVGALTVTAALVRAGAEHLASRYFLMLGLAASLWLVAALAWLLYLMPLMLRAKR